MNDVSTAKSRNGYIISFYGCPITWASKLQTQIALSTTEAEYIVLSQSLREVIPMINLMTEMNRLGVCNYCTIPKLYCKAFEDNSGALELVKAPKMRPRTTHINLAFHHFRHYVRLVLIVIYPVGTLDQLAGIFTKPLSSVLFEKHKKKITRNEWFGGAMCQEHWERECDDLRCDIRSCHKPPICGPRCKGVRLIGNQRNDDFQSESDGGYLQIPRDIVMTADLRVILRVSRHFTAYQSGATSD
jgi:hypothetical protein